MKPFYRLIAILFCLGAIVSPSLLRAAGEVPIVDARFSDDTVLIGDQFDLVVTVEKDRLTVIQFPVLPKGYLQPNAKQGIEVLADGPIDTLKVDGRRITLRKTYRMTCFDEGNYHSGPIPVMRLDKNITDTLRSRDSLHLMVNTIPVDTVKQHIHDVKAPMATPIRFGEFSGYLFGGLGVLLLLAAATYVLVRWWRNKPLRPSKKVVDPPHVVAIRELEAVHAQKLWQSGRHKLYYTRLTDILRTYICARFPIQAMEMTSQEIIDHMSRNLINERNMSQLKELLQTADFVKFAKYTPEDELNESAYADAYYFVEETKPVETKPTESPADTEGTPTATATTTEVPSDAASDGQQNSEKA